MKNYTAKDFQLMTDDQLIELIKGYKNVIKKEVKDDDYYIDLNYNLVNYFKNLTKDQIEVMVDSLKEFDSKQPESKESKDCNKKLKLVKKELVKKFSDAG